MKKLMLSLFISLLFFTIKAQYFVPIHNAQAPDWVAVIKYLGIPYGTIPALNTTRLDPGALFFKTTDSSLLVWSGSQWLAATIGGGGGSTTGIDSIWIKSIDSLAYRKSGTTFYLPFEIINPVTTVAGLRAIVNDPTGIMYFTTDYGSGMWQWNPTSIAADNTGTVVKVDVITVGRFERVFSGGKNIIWFGAIGDGTFSGANIVTGTDNQIPIQNCFNLGGSIYIPAGIFRHNDSLKINLEETFVQGDGENLSQLLYGGSVGKDQIVIDSQVNRGVKLLNLRLSGGGRARYNYISPTLNRSCEISHCKLRDALGVIKVSHGYYSNIDWNLFGPTILDAAANGFTYNQWKEVWQSGGAYTAPIFFGEMNGSSISHNRISQVQTVHYNGTRPAQNIFIYGEGVSFNLNTFETTGFDSAYDAATLIRIENNTSINIGGIYFEQVGSDWVIYADGKSFIDIKSFSGYNMRGNTVFYNRGVGWIKVANSVGHRMMYQRLREVVNAYTSAQDVTFERSQFIQGDRITDSTITPFAYNVFDTYNTGWPYGMTDGISVFTNQQKKRFLKVINGYETVYGTDANGAYVMVDCGGAILEDGSDVSVNLFVDGNAVTSAEKIKMKLRPNVPNRFYRVYLNRTGSPYLVENTEAFSHAKGDWTRSFQTDGSGAIINTGINPRVSINGAYLQNSDLIYASGAGSPEEILPATVGSFYTSTTNGDFYAKISGVATSAIGWSKMAFSNAFKVDSVKKKAATDSIFYYINGIAYFGFVDALSTSTTSIASNVSVSADNSWTVGSSSFALFNLYTRNLTSNNTLRLQTSLGTSPIIFTQNVTDIARFYGTSGSLVLSHAGSPSETTNVGFKYQSTTKFSMPFPVMTAAQASAIGTLVNGMVVCVTDTDGTFTSAGYWGYISGAWAKLNN